MREMIPVVIVEDKVLREGADFTFKKNEDRTVELFLTEKRLMIKMAAPNEGGIMYPGSDKTQFWINDHKLVPSSYTVFSHISGQFPGVSITFFGQPIKSLRLIPRLMDKVTERKTEREEYEKKYGKNFGWY